MYYAFIGMISIMIHLILNHEYFRNREEKNEANVAFKRYVWAVLCYYITDVLWGFIYELHIPSLLYFDTILYHIAIAMTVLLLCRYVTTYLRFETGIGKVINIIGLVFGIFEIILLFVNHFVSIFFMVDSNGGYHAYIMRYVVLYMQVFLCVLLAIQIGYIMRKTIGEMQKRYVTIFLFCVEMIIAISVQIAYPFLPIYSIGLVVGITIIHTFVKESEKEEQYKVLRSMSDIFYSMHVIDLVSDTVMEFNARNEVKEIMNRNSDATEMMARVMNAVTTDDYKEVALKFTDLTTIAERMRNKKTIDSQFVGKNIGWFTAMFVVIEADAERKPTKVIYATRTIDEEKKQEEKLIQRSQTDELTGLLNRRAYEETIYEYKDIHGSDNFIYVSLDVNGLKVVNDTKGHVAGDELIIGAAQCMKKSLDSCGKLFRIGGDEFVAILFCDVQKAKDVLSDFDYTIMNWSGELLDGLSISYGWVSKDEEPGASIRELSTIAERRMYASKAAHYRTKGVDRRGQQDAHKALCELYTKILKINISQDTYQIVNMDIREKNVEQGFSDKISKWLEEFGKSGQVHPEDLSEYLKAIDIRYMRNYFRGNKTSLQIFYRRKYGNIFKQVMMEIIPANDYSDDNQSLFLYVKDIDK